MLKIDQILSKRDQKSIEFLIDDRISTLESELSKYCCRNSDGLESELSTDLIP